MTRLRGDGRKDWRNRSIFSIFGKSNITKVIWVYTETEQIMVAEPNKHWEIFDWTETVEVVDGVGFNVAEIIAEFGSDFNEG